MRGPRPRSLFDISGHLGSGSAARPPRARRVYVDLDPGFTQVWHADPSVEFEHRRHDRYLDGRPEHRRGRLSRSRPPASSGSRRCRRCCSRSGGPAPAAAGPLTLTTVATWRSPYGALEIGGRDDGAEAPRVPPLRRAAGRVEGAEFEMALDIHPATRPTSSCCVPRLGRSSTRARPRRRRRRSATTCRARAPSSRSPRGSTSKPPPAGSATAPPPTWPPAARRWSRTPASAP